MTETEFRDQIVLQKELERILGGKVSVSDDDVNQYIAQNKVTTPKGMTDEDLRSSIREQLKGQKFNAEATKWVANAKMEAQIQYFVDYVPKPLPAAELPAGEASSKTEQ
jgi:parvulin-like peptidyl-prolyl isomerase